MKIPNVLPCIILQFLCLHCAREPVSRPVRINIAVPYEVDSLDPHSKDTISNFAIACNFYEPLVRTGPMQKILPAIASSWENPDLYTWIFHLRPGIKFHSGKPLQAEDVVYSFRRLMKDKSLEMRAYIASIESVGAHDSRTVVFRTKYAAGVFLHKLNFVMIVPSGSGPDSLTEKVDGSGPYRLVQWEKEKQIEMVRNENYEGTKPVLEQVVFFLSRKPSDAIQDLLSGKCGLVQSNSKELERTIRSSNKWEMLIHDSLFIKYLTFDQAREKSPFVSVDPNPFLNKSVRTAFEMGIDREQIVYRLPSFAVSATQPVPPFVFGFNPQIPSRESNSVKARSMLEQAGYPQGFEVTLHARKFLEQTADIVKKQLAEIGVRVNVQVLPDTEWFERVQKQDTSFFLSRLGCPTGDASDVLESAFHSFDAAHRYGIRNHGGYSNPEIDSLIEQSAGIVRTEQRHKALQSIMARLTEDVVWIPLYFDQEAYGIDKSYSWQPRNDSYILAQEISLRQ